MEIKQIIILNEEEKEAKCINFTDQITYFYSHAKNNKGKTIILNSIPTLFGNRSFPQGFDITKHIIMVEYEIAGKKVLSTLRGKKDHEVHIDNETWVISSQEELRQIWDDHIFKLPWLITNHHIPKTERKIILPELIVELFMGYQEKSDTTKINASDMYKKEFYSEFIYQLKNNEYNVVKNQEVTEKLKSLKAKKKLLDSTNKKIKKNSDLEATAELYSLEAEMIKRKIEELNQPIIKCSNEIKKISYKRNKLYELAKYKKRENQVEGYICNDCNSNNIIILYKSIKFNILNTHQMNQLDQLIEKDIYQYTRDLEVIIERKAKYVTELENFINSNNPIQLEVVEYFNNKEKIKELEKLIVEIKKLEDQIREPEKTLKNLVKTLELKIIYDMKEFNDKYELDDTLTNMKLFYTKDNHPSASSGTNLQHIKMIAINELLNEYKFPFVLDNFRNHELSSTSERKYLEYFTGINRQVILSATLKEEETIKSSEINYVLLNDDRLLQKNEYENAKKLYNEKYSKFDKL